MADNHSDRHSAANPLTARYGTPHGVAVGLLLPHVVRFNNEVAGADYARLVGGNPRDAGARLAERLIELLRAAALPESLAAAGIADPDFAALAEDAAGQWTAAHNPRPVAAADFAALYRTAAR